MRLARRAAVTLAMVVACGACSNPPNPPADGGSSAARSAHETPGPPASALASAHPSAPPPVQTSASAARSSAPAAAGLEVVAKLVDRGVSAPACGIVHVIVTMKYEIVDVIHGDAAKGATLYVAHGCPEMARETYKKGLGDVTRFEVGALHHLTLQLATPDEESHVADHADRKGAPLYMPLRADMQK